MAQEKDVMTLAEVARYLQLAKKTVLRMARQGKIPAAKVASQWRFLRPVINDWLASQMQYAPVASPPDTVVALTDQETGTPSFKSKLITLNLKPASSQTILEELIELLKNEASVPASQQLLTALIQQQQRMTMAVGPGVAICQPTAPLPDLVQEPVIAVGVCKKGTDFAALDGSPTHVFLLVCATDEQSDLILTARATWLSHQHDLLADLRNCGSKKKAAEMLNKAVE
jgi:excisionase family DNA binding protein